nr:zinc finger, BED-type, phospholipase-like, homeodomain-like protein [Tanacetum cinerariifolium]
MVNQGYSSTIGVGSSSASTIVEILPCKRNPEIWSHYNLCKMSDNTQKAQCIHCFNFYSMASNSTLRAHFTHPHCVALKTTPEPSQPSMGRDGSVFVYNSDYLREQFAGLVISRGLPFNHFDNEETTMVFQNTMQPRYNHVSRSTLKRDAMKLWATAKQLIIDGFLNLNARVNITTDVWSAGHGLFGALDFEEEILTIEVQDNEATPLSDEEITLDVACQGTMASGSGGEEPESDYDLTHYDIDD